MNLWQPNALKVWSPNQEKKKQTNVEPSPPRFPQVHHSFSAPDTAKVGSPPRVRPAVPGEWVAVQSALLCWALGQGVGRQAAWPDTGFVGATLYNIVSYLVSSCVQINTEGSVSRSLCWRTFTLGRAAAAHSSNCLSPRGSETNLKTREWVFGEMKI